MLSYFEIERGLQLYKKATVAKGEGISRISFNRKTVGSGSTTNISASFGQSIGENRGRAEREKAKNEKEKTGVKYKTKMR